MADFWTSDVADADRAGRAQAKSYVQQPGTTMGVGGAGLRDDAYRRGQGMYGEFLSALSQPNQPSAAMTQQQMGLEAAGRSGQSLAAGASGANQAFARRNAANVQGDMQSQAIQQAMMARIQEEMMRKQMFAQALGQSTQLGSQMQLGQEGIAAQNYATSMGGNTQPGAGQQLLGPLVSAGGAIVGGALAGGGGAPTPPKVP